MKEKNRKTGIAAIGDVPWGTHFCQFYHTPEELTDILVPYFKAGLENNEFCIWVTSAPLNSSKAQKSIKKIIPDFEQYVTKGQMKIIPHTDWYLKHGIFNPQRVVAGWINELNQALAKGYDGMRVSGNTAWLKKTEWQRFSDYEAEMNKLIGKYQILAICSYSLDKCGAFELIEAAGNHQFSLIRQGLGWRIIESPERRRAVETLRRARHELEIRVEERTAELVRTNRQLQVEIAERKQAEDKLKQAYQSKRDILEKAPFGIYVVNAEGNIEYVNPTMLKISGSTYEQFKSLNIFDLPTYRQLGLSKKIKAGLKGKYFKLDAVGYTSHFGHKTSIRNFSGIPLKENDKQKVLIIVEDISNAKRTEAELTKHREQLEGLVKERTALLTKTNKQLKQEIKERKRIEEKIKLLAVFPAQNPDPVLRIKKNGYIQFANQASRPIVEALETKPGELLPAKWRQIIAETYDSQSSKEIELNHHDRVFSIIITPFTGTGYLYAYGRDITGHRQAEAALEDALKASQQHETEISALLAGAQTVLNYQDFDKAAKAIYNICKKIIGSTAGYVALLSPDGKHNEVLFLDSGKFSRTVDPNLPMPVRGLRGVAHHNQQVVYDNDFSHSKWVKFMPEGHVKLDNVMFAPLALKGKVAGLIGLADKPGGFTENDARLASAFGEIAAVALHNSRTLEMLEHSEARFRSIFKDTPIGIVTVNAGHRIIGANKVVCRMLGYTEQELTRLSMPDIIYHEDKEKDLNLKGELLNEETLGCKQEKCYVRKDGSLFWGNLTTSVALDSSGNPLYLIGMLEDITKRKRVEQEIKLIANFSAENPNPVLRIKSDGYIEYANSASRTILDALKSRPRQFLSGKWKQRIKKIYNSQKTKEVEVKYNGQVFSISIIPFADTDYLYAYGRDITERKQIEEKIQIYQEQLRFLAAELSFAEERERRRIAVELHDHIIQNLGFTKIRLESLEETAAGFGQATHLNTINELQKIIEEMIQYTRTLTFDLSPPILYDLGFEAAVEWLVEQINERHDILASFEDDLQPKPLEDDIRILLFQSTSELLLNAAKHAQASRVKVFIKRKKNQIRVDVEDDGMGFDPAKISPQLDKNSGFGLFSIRERLDYLGGCLKLDSAPGGGTLASLLAPLKLGKHAS